jgi:transposase-like protein
MNELVSVGDFCPNPDCEDYGKIEDNHIIRYGKTKNGRQRFQCKTCHKTFNERKGTMFYNRKTDEQEIVECLVVRQTDFVVQNCEKRLHNAVSHPT